VPAKTCLHAHLGKALARARPRTTPRCSHSHARRPRSSWEGEDDGDSKCGRGWAALEADGTLKGRFFIHRGDDSWFTAMKGVPVKKTGARR
jgi:hypothetical protein